MPAAQLDVTHVQRDGGKDLYYYKTALERTQCLPTQSQSSAPRCVSRAELVRGNKGMELGRVAWPQDIAATHDPEGMRLVATERTTMAG